MKQTKLTKKQCKQFLKDHYKDCDDQYKKIGVLSKNAQYRIDHSIAVANIVKMIIKKNPDKFPDEELNKEFIKACILHDIAKMTNNEHHAEDAGIILMALGFSNDVIVPITLHSIIKEKDCVDKKIRKNISNYLLALQDADIVSKYNIKSLIKSHDGVEDTLNVISRLINRLKTTDIYFHDAEILLEEGIIEMIKYIEFTNSVDRFKNLFNTISEYTVKYYNR